MEASPTALSTLCTSLKGSALEEVVVVMDLAIDAKGSVEAISGIY